MLCCCVLLCGYACTCVLLYCCVLVAFVSFWVRVECYVLLISVFEFVAFRVVCLVWFISLLFGVVLDYGLAL